MIRVQRTGVEHLGIFGGRGRSSNLASCVSPITHVKLKGSTVMGGLNRGTWSLHAIVKVIEGKKASKRSCQQRLQASDQH